MFQPSFETRVLSDIGDTPIFNILRFVNRHEYHPYCDILTSMCCILAFNRLSYKRFINKKNKQIFDEIHLLR